MYYVSLTLLTVSMAIAVVLGQYFGVAWVNWHYVDVATVIFGGVGFFTVAGESYRLTPTNELQTHERRLENGFRHVRLMAELLRGQICRTFQKTQYSPPDLDRSQHQHDLACPWANDLYAKIEQMEAGSLPFFGPDLVPDLPAEVTDEYIIEIRDRFCAQAKAYADHRSFVMDFRKKLERPFVEQVFIFVSPYFVSVAIGLALFKALYGP